MGVLSTMRGVQYRGGYHEYCWGISWVPWGVQYHGDIMSTVGVILSTMGMFSTVGGYHDARGGISWVPWGCSVPWGDTILWNLSTMGGYHDTCGGISWVLWGCSVPWGTQITKDFPPTVLMISPTCITLSAMVLNIPHSTQDNPHSTHDIPTVLNTPTVLKISPTFITISPTFITLSPTVLNTPHGTQDIPHGTAHTLYRVVMYKLFLPSFIYLFTIQFVIWVCTYMRDEYHQQDGVGLGPLHKLADLTFNWTLKALKKYLYHSCRKDVVSDSLIFFSLSWHLWQRHWQDCIKSVKDYVYLPRQGLVKLT